VSFAAIIPCVASQRVFIIVVDFVMTQSGNFWIHTRITHLINFPVFMEPHGSVPFSGHPANILRPCVNTS
jgi:hypothetical protein